ncbi:MAG: hypothetical protein PHU27_04070 [Salinivirgaceae bacterium]|nr:hypothetical protein [Salinivirgaceae bacterium]MDY0280081.1 putative porin [Salinivirgaceae bacterium]
MHKLTITTLFLFALLMLNAQEVSDSLKSMGGIVREHTNRDSIIPDTTIFAWRHLKGGTEQFVDADTNQINIVYHDPIKDQMIYNVGLGNIGQAILQTEFSKRIYASKLHWSIKHYDAYLRTYDKTVFFNTKTPYTRLYYISGAEKWQTFHFIHTQNINKNINFGARYDIYSSMGYFVAQEARNRNGSFWFNVKNYRYRNVLSINFNRLKISNNGGVVNNAYITDSTHFDLDKTDVRLKNSGNDIRMFDGFMEHEIAIVRTDEKLAYLETGLAHEIHFALTQRKYYDPLSTKYNDIFTNQIYDFYTSRYNSLKTEDTLSTRQLKNAAGIYMSMGKRNKIKVAAMLQKNQERYRNSYRDTLFNYKNDTLIETNSFLVRLNGKSKNEAIKLTSHFEYNPFKGYKKDEYNGSINISFRHRIFKDTALLSARYQIHNTMPDYFMMNYYSNHYKWKNRWPMQKGANVGANWTLLKSRFTASVELNSFKNHLWLDQNRIWNLTPYYIDVVGIGIEKTQSFGKHFSLRAKVIYQNSSDTIIDLPKFATSATLMFETPLHFKSTGGKAHLQMGIDCWLNSSYYVPNFDPALNQFFMQRSMKIGNYPFVDVFISARIKRMVLFTRLEHITAGSRGTTYFEAYNYPARPFTMKFGVSWTFYD